MPITDAIIVAAIVAAFIVFAGGIGLGRIPDQASEPAARPSGSTGDKTRANRDGSGAHAPGQGLNAAAS